MKSPYLRGGRVLARLAADFGQAEADPMDRARRAALTQHREREDSAIHTASTSTRRPADKPNSVSTNTVNVCGQGH